MKLTLIIIDASTPNQTLTIIRDLGVHEGFGAYTRRTNVRK